MCNRGPVGADERQGESITPEGIVALRAEIEQLEGEARMEMAARIKTARELGDLSENADYHIAKEDQAHLETKIKRLRAKLANAAVVDSGADSGDDAFAFGRTAEIVDEASGKTHTWRLVGSTEADIEKGRISAESPVGRALRDARVGETVKLEAPGGEKTFRVKSLVD